MDDTRIKHKAEIELETCIKFYSHEYNCDVCYDHWKSSWRIAAVQSILDVILAQGIQF